MIQVAGGGDHDVLGLVDPGEEAGEALALQPTAASALVPRIERPRGWSGQKASAKSSMTRSSGVSSTMLISSKMTFFSRVISSGSKRGFTTMSPRISVARGRCSSTTLRWNEAYSLAVKASMWPPMESISSAMRSRRAVLRPLEDHVLDEVADAALLRPLVTAAPLEPHPHRHAAHRGNGLGDQGEAVVEGLLDDHVGAWGARRGWGDAVGQTSTPPSQGASASWRTRGARASAAIACASSLGWRSTAWTHSSDERRPTNTGSRSWTGIPAPRQNRRIVSWAGAKG